MKHRRHFSWFITVILALGCLAAETPVAPESGNPNEVRPTGVPAHRSKSKASAKANDDESAAATATPRRARRATRHRESEDDSIPTQTVPGSIPRTGAVSAIVINAISGQVMPSSRLTWTRVRCRRGAVYQERGEIRRHPQFGDVLPRRLRRSSQPANAEPARRPTRTRGRARYGRGRRADR